MKASEFILWLVCIVGGLLSCFWIGANLFREGYNYGEFSAKYSNNLKFNLYQDSVLLVENAEDSNKYEYTTTFSSAFQVDPEFDAEENEYILELNGQCFATTNIHHGVAEANLNFTFLDTQGEELLTDTLHIQINFYLGSTNLYMFTTGGAEAVEYWNYLFDSTHFDLRVYKVADGQETKVISTNSAIAV